MKSTVVGDDLTGLADLTVMIIPVLTRFRNRNTCSGVGGEVIQARASDTSINLIKWMKFS